MTTKVTSEFLHQAIISDHTQVSAASTDHVLIHDASDNTLKKALVSTISSGATALDDIGTGDAASTLATSSGDIILDSPDSIVLDADGDGSVSFKDGGTRYALIEKSSDNLIIRADLSDGDIIFQGKDNTSTITALTLDMSAEGGATFNANVTLGDNKGVYFGAGSDLIISSDGTNGVLDCSGDIIFDADGGDILFKDDGLLTATLSRNVGNFEITVNQSDGDFVVKGNDGGSTVTPFRLDMSTGGRALFSSDLVALETAGQYLQIAGSSSNYWAMGSTGGNNTPGTASTTLAFHHWDGSAWDEELSLDASGNLTADGNVTAYSDERLKDNIQTLENGLDKVNQLRGITYTRKEKENIGVVAQEVEKILPQIVLTADDEIGTKSVDYSRLTAVLIEAVKELSQKIEKLEGK